MWWSSGSRFDIKGNTLGAWIARVVIVAFILIGCLIVFRLVASGASAQDNPIPPSGGAIIMKAALPDPVEAGWKGEKTCEVLQENERVRALRCAFNPGEGHEKHFHAPHFGYILEGGVMEITDASGTREQETPAGTSWWLDGVDWHRALNVGETRTVYVIVEPKRGI
ncbi:MAG: hypothetical protein AAFW81_12740 [Pseudomonadota bacterium]